ncbi:uncharacterized protein K452DRAFT_291150 [Aplosporella prunicola CBS 121167]|uniref:DUF1772 domain-containing protein n=1 Tax=Aplosporella prunicola CBS 121167 TaxID=1176127 RepID=A0A6A6B4H0_9PEZI|nr:uncharacterized protein K452DRAFT_291150 [Aplosporella prunicola CBS 121167]KAF2138104.1 hypothetical protein K452DRAFT_291150 [Aplosporella prunicola CBS 121167]
MARAHDLQNPSIMTRLETRHFLSHNNNNNRSFYNRITMATAHALGLGPGAAGAAYRATQLFSLSALALLAGSTAWSTLAVLPSLVVAPMSSHAKLSALKGIVLLSNAALPPTLLGTIASLAFLALRGSLAHRSNHLIALGAAAAALALQIPLRPRLRAIVEIVDRGQKRKDDGRDANWRIKEVWRYGVVRMVLCAVAFGVEAWMLMPQEGRI